MESARRGRAGDNHNRRGWGRDVNFDLRDIENRVARDNDTAGQQNSRTKASDTQKILSTAHNPLLPSCPPDGRRADQTEFNSCL